MVVSQWGSKLGLHVLQNLSTLYLSLVWESSTLIGLCSDNVFPPDCQFGAADIDRIMSRGAGTAAGGASPTHRGGASGSRQGPSSEENLPETSSSNSSSSNDTVSVAMQSLSTSETSSTPMDVDITAATSTSTSPNKHLHLIHVSFHFVTIYHSAYIDKWQDPLILFSLSLKILSSNGSNVIFLKG